MKIFIASDLHGSAYYTSLMVEAFLAENADRMVLLGDILYHGPRNDLPKEYNPREVSLILNKYADKIIAVRGNCEAEVDSLMLDFCVTSEYGVIFDGKNSLYLSHGHREKPKMHCGSIYLTGHTHVPHDFIEDGVRCINPGSVSIPKNNSPHSICVYNNSQFSWKDIVSGENFSISE